MKGEMKAKQGRGIVAAAMVAVFSLAASLHADGVIEWTEIDGSSVPSTWPTAGNVRIKAGDVVRVGDDEVDIVAGWDNLAMGTTQTSLVFTNKTRAANLKANVRGYGRIVADNSFLLTLSGDNSNLLTGCRFTNSKVCVSNEFGLGSSSTTGTYVDFGSTGSLHFGLPDAKAFTNHCAITYTGNENTRAIVFGSEAVDEYFVQDGNLLHDNVDTKRPVTFKNNFEMISGRFPSTARKGKPLYFYTTDDNAVVRFSNDTVIDTSGGDASRRDGLYWLGNGTVWLGQDTEPVLDIFANSGGRINIGSGAALNGLRSLWCYLNDTPIDNPTRYIDLHGHDMAVGTIRADSGPSESNTKYHIIRSEEPATITISGYATTSYNSSHACLFDGNLSVVMADAISTNVFCSVVSRSSGDMTVTAGTLELKWGAGWSGTNVTVSGTGVLRVNSVRAFTNGVQKLNVSGDGKLVLCASSTAKFAEATFGAVSLAQGVYTVADLKAMPGVASYVDGDSTATIEIAGAAETWNGWPAEEGASAVVPAGETVYLRDDDVANAAKLGELILRSGSVVVVSNASQRLSFAAPVSGSGKIRIVDSCGVALLGDNSGLVSPGGFEIVNSYVAVSNRFGLGSSGTAATTVMFTTLDKPLIFGLASGGVFTNEVDLVVNQTVNNTMQVSFGTESKDAWLVQKGSFTTLVNGAYANRFKVLGSVEFITSYQSPNSGTQYFAGTPGGTIKFGQAVQFSSNSGKIDIWAYLPARNDPSGDGTGRLVLACTGRQIKTVGLSVADVLFEAENVSGDPENTDSALYYSQQSESQWYYRAIVDLNGHNQAFRRFASQYDRLGGSGVGAYAEVTSSVPAALTIASSVARNRMEVLKFRGSAGFTYAGVGTNLFVDVASDTTGDYTVQSGVSGFDLGATWAGTNITVAGGTLYVGAASAAVGVFGTLEQVKARKTRLSMSPGARLYLESGTTTVYEATLGGEFLDRGVHDSTSGWIDGAGTLRVLHDNKGFVLIYR